MSNDLILCVSVGNTNIRCAAGARGRYRQAVVPTEDVRKAEDFTRFLEERFHPEIWKAVTGSMMSSVVPDKSAIVGEAIRLKTGTPPRLVGISGCGVDFSRYKNEIGQDRAVCCAAAAANCAGPLVVVDFGTATTINVISGERVFLGGAILTGIRTGLHALSRDTALLPEVENFSDVGLIGDDTRSSLISGAVIGLSCAVGGYLSRISVALDITPRVVVTGGSAPMVTPYCDFDFVYEPALLIDGLFMIYDKGGAL